MSRVLDGLLDLLFPPKCPFCHRLLAPGCDPLCPDCRRTLPWLSGTNLETTVELTAGCLSPLAYRDEVRESVHRFKFGGRSGYSAIYAALMAQAVRERWPDVRFDAVSYVPLSRRRRRKRGYDQAQLLARDISVRLGLPCMCTLRKCRHTAAQSMQTDAGSRKVNVMNAYKPAREYDLSGKTLLLCDDVVTTGSTLSECARVLRTAGASKVYAVTLARAGK